MKPIEMRPYTIKIHYLDASAMVKLIADDKDEVPGRDAIRDYYWKHTPSMYATQYCISEALGVFKKKQLRKVITDDQYIDYCYRFIHRLIGANLRIDELSILSPVVFREAEDLFRSHGIDIIDSLQIATVLHGKFRVFSAGSKTVLITADRALAEAARSKNVRVWNCLSEDPPDDY